jgi:CheY-like chemotaxis protein
VLARAMEPFFSTKPMGKGTGLGLAQVYGIAHQSGGTVRIESEPGRGTIVRILLPATDAEAESAATGEDQRTASVEPGRQRATILVIDDDADVRSFITDALEGLGHRVEEADSGEAGLAKLGDCEPDLILVDFAMPGMNGADVARQVRERHCDLPVIFVTGYAESEQLEAALGADVPVLRKPFALDDLAAMVSSYLHGSEDRHEG